MKRFMLVSLMSCMLVGQLIAEGGSYIDYGKGLAIAAVQIAGFSVAGALMGSITAGIEHIESKIFDVKKESLSSLRSLCFEGALYSCCLGSSSIAGTAYSKYRKEPKGGLDESNKMTQAELLGKQTPFLIVCGVLLMSPTLNRLYKKT